MEVIVADFLTDKQKQDVVFFNENLQQWARDPIYKMKFAVIHDEKLQGIFDTFEIALGDAVKKFQPSEFIIQQIINSDEFWFTNWSRYYVSMEHCLERNEFYCNNQ